MNLYWNKGLDDDDDFPEPRRETVHVHCHHPIVPQPSRSPMEALRDVIIERDQLRARVAKLEAMLEKLGVNVQSV